MSRPGRGIVLSLMFFLFLIIIVGCGKQSGSDLTGVTNPASTGSPVASGVISRAEDSAGSPGHLLGVFQVIADPQKGTLTIQKVIPNAPLGREIQMLTDVAADTSESNIVFQGNGGIAGATFVAAGAAPPATCNGLPCGPTLPVATLRQNVVFRNNTTFPIYETKAVFFTWSPAGTGLNSNSQGFILPITVTSTQITPNTQTFSAFPFGAIDMGDANAGALSTPARLWIFTVPGGVLTKAGFLLMEYQWRSVATGVTNSWAGTTFFRDPVTGTTQGWICGTGGAIRTSTDFGVTWTAQTSGTASDLIDCSAGDLTRVWAVGLSGTIRHSSDGGATWVGQTSGTTQFLGGVHFADNNRGWAVGGGGTIRHTTDRGGTWNAETSCSGVALRGVFAFDRDNAWVVGDSGVVCRTTDAGTTWTGPKTLSPATTATLFNSYFVDLTTGYLVGNGGRVYKTTDGGETWTQQTSNTTANLGGIFCKDASNCWFSGTGGAAGHTTNGGTTWTIQATPSAAVINEIDLKNDANGNHQLWGGTNSGAVFTYR